MSMLRLTLFLILLQTDTNRINRDTPVNNSIPTHSIYSSGVIPEEVPPADLPQSNTTLNHVNPFQDIHPPAVEADHQKNDGNDLQAEMDSFANKSASNVALTAPENFDWQKTNADRFINSPCYKDLGFDPRKDPQEQEKAYQECEAGKTERKGVNGLIIILIIVALVGIITFATKVGK